MRLICMRAAECLAALAPLKNARTKERARSAGRSRFFRCVALRFAACALVTLTGFAQTDPGPRSGAAAAGGPVPGLSSDLMVVFQHGSDQFQEVEMVADGLGPRFNSNACSSCHAQPAIGGTSPHINPQVQFANAKNPLPPFITASGPVREVRFIRKPDGSKDGGVHNLFTIMGRPDTPPGCTLAPEDFSNASNIITRIPTPLFGLGLIEAIPDQVLEQNVAHSASKTLGIQGTLNRSGNDGTVTRFGWKAQNKSLLIFAGEAYNVEMGITNFLFNTERDETPHCSPSAPPNDIFNVGGLIGAAVFDDPTNFGNFMRFLAPPARGPIDSAVERGSLEFVNIGCANCHTATFTTGASVFAPLANQVIHPFSDFALHHMGNTLADHISQGSAGGDQFRTAPLWGLGQRLFFLHDGRTNDLLQSIKAHRDGGSETDDDERDREATPSEADAVIEKFFQLTKTDQQAILNFLRSL
jgi:CxxC motif-containing protein (DUF1111 family)